MQDDELLNEQAQLNLINKPSPRMQGFIEKYNKLDYATAKKYKVENVKMMIDDYQSGNLHKELPDLSDEEVVKAIAKMESQDDGPDDSFLSKALDVPVQVVGGFRDAAQAVMDLGSSVGEWGAGKVLESQGFDKQTIDQAKKDTKGVQLPEVSAPKSTVGSLTRGVSQFLAPFGVLSKAGKAAGVVGKATSTVGKFAEASAVGAATDFLAFGEHEKRLSDLVETQPALSNPVTRYLKSDINDGVAEGRFKNALEGLGLGMAAEGLFQSVKWIKNAKETKSAISQLKGENLKSTESISNISKELISEREKLQNAGFDNGAKATETLMPERITKRMSLAEIRDLAANSNLTMDDLLDVKRLEEFKSQGFEANSIKATVLQAKAYEEAKKVIPDIYRRIEIGDVSAREEYKGVMRDLLLTDHAAKDLHTTLARAEVLRRHEESVSIANKFTQIFENIDKYDERKIIDMHADAVMNGVDPTPRLNALLMTPSDKIKKVLSSTVKANLLSGWQTHVNNIFSNTSMLAFAPTERFLGAAVSNIRNAKFFNTSKKIQDGFFSNGEIHWKESQILLKSYADNIGSAFSYIGKAVKRETETATIAKQSGDKISVARDILSKLNTKTPFQKGMADENLTSAGFTPEDLGLEKHKLVGTGLYHTARYLGKYSNFVANVSMTYDRAFQALHFSGEAKALSYRMADDLKAAGVDVGSNTDFLYNLATVFRGEDNILEGLAKEHPELFTNLTETNKSKIVSMVSKISESSEASTKEFTFMKDLGGFSSSIQEFRNKIDSAIPYIPLGTYIMPFIKTVSNINSFIFLDRGPLAPLTKSWQKEIAAGGTRADMAYAKLASGTMLHAGGLYLALQGKVTGVADSPKQRELWKADGIQENSLEINGKYYDLSKLDPLGSFLTVPANAISFYDKMLDEEDSTVGEYMVAGILKTSNYLTSKSYMMGLADLMDAIVGEDDKGFERMIKNMAAVTLTPNIITQTARTVNENAQDPDSLLEIIKDKYGMNIRPKRNIFGEEVTRNPKVNPYFIPISYSNWKNDAVVEAMIDAGAYIQKPKKTIENIELTYDQYDRLMEFMKEQNVYGHIKNLIESPLYKATPAVEATKGITTKAELIKDRYNTHLKIAKARLLASDPELQKKDFDFKLKAFTKPARTSGDTRLLNNLSGKINNE